MIPGELLTDPGEHTLNTGRRTLTLVVRNTGDVEHPTLTAPPDARV